MSKGKLFRSSGALDPYVLRLQLIQFKIGPDDEHKVPCGMWWKKADL